MTAFESRWLIMSGGEGGDHTTLTDFEVILLKTIDCDGAKKNKNKMDKQSLFQRREARHGESERESEETVRSNWSQRC